MSTPFLRTKVPCMAKWVLLLSMTALSSYPLLTDGLPLRQGPLSQETELDQCEFVGYEDYGEQCGSKIVQLPLCNPGQRIRGWQCDPETLEDDFTPDNLDICQSCPPGFYQKWYNKCEMCHPCTVCREGETEEKACEMDKDTNCTVISTTESLQPFDTPLEATVSTRAPPLKPPSTVMPTNPTPTEGTFLEIITTSRTAPTIESPFDQRTTPHDPKGWLHVAFIVVSAVLALLFVLAVIACCRERFKKRRLRALVHKQEFELNPMNGDVPHHNEEQPNERCPLMDEGVEPERNQVHRDDAEKNDCNDGPHGPPADVEEHDADEVPDGAHDTRRPLRDSPLHPSTSGGASNEGTGCSGGGEKDDISSPSGGLVVDIPDKSGAGATEHPSDNTNLFRNPPPESATGASGADFKDGVGMDAPTTSGGHGVSKPGETLVDGRNGATGAPPDDLGTPNATTTSASGGHVVNKPEQTLAGVSCSTPAVSPDDLGTPNATTTSGGDCSADDANSDGVDTSGSNDGDMEGPGSVRAPPSAAPEEGATSAGIDSNGTADTDGANHGAEASGGGQDVPVVESSDDVPAGKRSGACGHSADGADVDAREPNSAAPEQVKPQIQADDVVSHKFLQLVAQLVPYLQVKVICRMLGLQEKDIDNIEVLEHKAEWAYKFLKRLLCEIGKDLTYRSLLEALNNSQNKYYADILIREFDIRI